MLPLPLWCPSLYAAPPPVLPLPLCCPSLYVAPLSMLPLPLWCPSPCVALPQANRLQLHYKIIPPSVSPSAVLQCQAQWGLDYPVHLFDSKSPPESHYLPGMVAWLDYCSGIAARAHPALTQHLSTAILEQFLVLCVQADLVES